MPEHPSYETFNPLQEQPSPAEPNASDSENRQVKIRSLNDQFRQTLRGGKILTTPGVSEFGSDANLKLLDKIRNFDEFDTDNDPYGEHDFGSLVFEDNLIYWKIDYYDLSLQGGSDTPEDAQTTRRVMTIMLAEEY